MGEFLDAFPGHLRDRLIAYAAQDPDNFRSALTLAELEKLPLNLSDKQWQEVRDLIRTTEVRSLDYPDYEPTEKTKEVAEVEGFFS